MVHRGIKEHCNNCSLCCPHVGNMWLFRARGSEGLYVLYGYTYEVSLLIMS